MILMMRITREWRCGANRYAATQERLAIDNIRVDQIWRRSPWRSNVVKKAAPFIVGDYKNSIRPEWTVGNSGERPRQERVARANVSMRMIVVSVASVSDREGWIHERYCGKCPGRCVEKKLLIWT